MPASQPQLVVDQALSHVLQVPGWAPTPPPSRPVVAPKRRRFLQAVREAARFNARTFAAVPSWMRGRGLALLESQLRDTIYGRDSGMLVDLGPRVVEDPGRAATHALKSERERLLRDTSLEASRAPAPLPVTWRSLRTVALGLVDGGELDGMHEPRNLGRREVLAPGDVVVNPGAEWRDDVATVPADDPAVMRAHRAALGALVAEAQEQLDEAEQVLDDALEKARKRAKAAAKRRRAQAAAQAAKRAKAAAAAQDEADDEDALSASDEDDESPADERSGALSEAADQDDEQYDEQDDEPDDEAAEAAAFAADVESDRDVRRARAALAAAQAELDVAEARRDAYEGWFATQSRTLLWRLGDDVGRRAHEHRETVRRIEESTADPVAPAAEKLARARKRLTWFWAVVLLGWLAVVVTMVLLEKFAPEPDWAQTAIRCAYVTLAVPVLLAIANHSLYRKVLAYEHRLQQQIVQLRHDIDEYLFSGQEARRLEALYGSLRDWVGILGEVVRRPWQAPPRAFEDVADSVVDAFPAAMGVARQPEDAALPLLVRTNAYRLVYQQGWASWAFNRAYEEFEGEMPAAVDGHLEVDLDVAGTPVGARARLRDFWAAGRARATLSGIRLEALRDAVTTGDLVLPTRVVGRVGRYSDGLETPEPEFFRAVGSEVTAFAQHVFSPAGLQSRRHYVQRSVVWMPRSARGTDGPQGGDAVEVRPCAGPTAVRVDLSGRVGLHELGIFTSRQEPLAAEPREHAVDAHDEVPQEVWY